MTAVMLVVYKNKILILRRSNTAPWQPNKWNLPGGGIHNESALDAAIRECQEEAGITPQNVKFLKQIEDIYAFYGVMPSDEVYISANEGIIESDAWEWISQSQLSQYEFAHPAIPLLIAAVPIVERGNTMNVTLTACDKDSSAGYVKSFEFTDKANFLDQYKEFEGEVPFSRWYLDLESEDVATEAMVEEWLDVA